MSLRLRDFYVILIIAFLDIPPGKAYTLNIRLTSRSESQKSGGLHMLSRFSVKKPYTVVVAVVLVILLGIVSVTKMNTDLLPSMNLPYAIVMTTYVGASPEAVEETVTKPIEQSMATVSNIKNVSSVSRENASVVVLEFEETTNMDSVSLEMRENLDQIKGYWDDTIGNPIIMKLNPDMLPVLVAAVDVDGLSAAETTDYIEDNVQPNIESIDGVARVSSSGGVTESVEVRINQEKLDAANQKVKDAINGKFQEEEQKLDDAQAELNDGKAELESGKKELESGQNQAASQIGQGSGQLSQAQSELTKNAAEIDVQLQNLESKQAELDSQAKILTETENKLNETVEKLTEAKSGLTQAAEGKAKLEEAITQIADQIKQLEDQIAALSPQKPDSMTEEEWQKTLEDLTSAKEQLAAQKAELEQQLQAIVSQLENLDEDTINTGLAAANKGLEEIAKAKAELSAGQQQLDAGKQKLQEVKQQIQAGQSQMTSAQIQLETQKILASVQLGSASSKIAMGSSQLEAAQTQLDSGREQLDNAKEQAQDKADLNTILTTDMVKGILTAENFSMPAGYVTEEKKDFLVRVGDKVQDVESLGDLVLLDLGLDGLASIRLSDVADITVTDDSSEVYAKINGNPGVMLSIEKQTGYSTGDVTDKILDRMESLEKENEGLHFTTLMNQGIYIDMVVSSVLENMIYGGILAILVLFLFLRDIKPTFVIACSIPISVVTALVLMYFSGVTLNIISLSGLALGVGMLVDNSIVVIENIYRMRSEGVHARKAAVEGARQVAGAIVSSTLTTVCVFAPIVFTEGITRQLFVDMGLTIAYSLAASLVVALTLVPMMSAGLLKRAEAKHSPFLEKVQNAYGQSIRFVLHHKIWVLLGALILFLGSMYISVKKGTEFFPSMESTQASMTVTTEKGTPLGDTAAKADEVIDKISDIEDIETIGAMAGGSAMSLGGSSTNEVTMYLVLKEDKKLSSEKLEKEILKRTKDVKGCEVTVSTSNMDMSAMGGSGIQVEIKGKELETLQEIATDLASRVEKIEGTQNVDDGLEETDAQYKIIVDKAKAMRNNLTVAQVFQEVNKKLAEATKATTVSTAAKDYDVYVRSEKDESLTREQLEDITISTTNAEGETKEIKVGDIADFEESVSPQSITRDSQSRYMSVTAEVASGYNIGLIGNEVQKIVDDYETPEGYTLEMKGEDETINEAMGQLMQMLALALVFMYLIMVAQFQSLLSPFIIMFTIPLAFTGGFLGLIISDKPVSIVAMVGFVMLSGIIVNNGIVLVDYINQLRKEGMEKREAIAQAGRARLRPIVMTALTTILGLVTMAMGMGMGADMVQPMAIVTIGGLIYGTLLTLFVVPCIYDILNRRHYKKDEERLVDEE